MTTAQISKESTRQDIWDLLMKVIKSKTDLGIIKFFSSQTVQIIVSICLLQTIKYKKFYQFCKLFSSATS